MEVGTSRVGLRLRAIPRRYLLRHRCAHFADCKMCPVQPDSSPETTTSGRCDELRPGRRILARKKAREKLQSFKMAASMASEVAARNLDNTNTDNN